MAVSAATLDPAALYALYGLAMPASASPARAEATMAIQKDAMDAAGAMVLELLGSLPPAGTTDLATALASLQVLDPSTALARLSGG